MTDVTDGTPNAVIARATSSWIAFNLEKRKLARIPQTVIDEFQTQALPGAPVMGADYEAEKLPDAFWEKYDLKEIILEFRNECHDGDNVDAICCRECGEEGVLNCEEKPGEAQLVHMLLKRGFGMSPKEAEVVRARSVWREKR